MKANSTKGHVKALWRLSFVTCAGTRFCDPLERIHSRAHRPMAWLILLCRKTGSICFCSAIGICVFANDRASPKEISISKTWLAIRNLKVSKQHAREREHISRHLRVIWPWCAPKCRRILFYCCWKWLKLKRQYGKFPGSISQGIEKIPRRAWAGQHRHTIFREWIKCICLWF